MLSPLSPKFKEFPKDDALWWVRWFDFPSPRHGGTSTSSITVYLSPIPEEILEKTEVNSNFYRKFSSYQKNTTIIARSIHIGSIPALPIGTIIKNQKVVGSLPLESATITTDTLVFPQRVLPANSPCEKKPSWWTSNAPYLLLNKFEYSLGSLARHSWLCLIQADNLDYLIPCSEIFRFFYAWKPKMARLFTSGPWKEQINKAVNCDKNRGKTGITKDGDWMIEARLGFTKLDCQMLAPIVLDEVGKSRANKIFTDFQNKTTLSDPVSLKAEIPFRNGPLELYARGLWLNQDKFLVFQFSGYKWIYPKLHWEIENSGTKGVIVEPTQREKPFSSGEKQGENRPGPPNINSAEDPQSGRKKVFYETPPINIAGIILERQNKEISYEYRKTKSSDSFAEDGDGDSSTGEPNHGRNKVSPAEMEPVNIPSLSRFSQIIRAITTLKNRGDINNYRFISPTFPLYFCEGTPLWPMPKINNEDENLIQTPWCFINSESYKRLRTALVLEVYFEKTHVQLIDLETRISNKSQESFCALLIQISDRSKICDSIDEVLNYAIAAKGRWGNATCEILGGDIFKFKIMKHIKGNNSELDCDYILKSLRQFI